MMAQKRNKAFRILADWERRQLMLALLEHNPQTDGPFVYPDAVPALDDRDQKQSRIQMNHAHLPVLEQAGVIEWNRENRQIVKGPNFEDIRPLLEFLRENTARVEK